MDRNISKKDVLKMLEEYFSEHSNKYLLQRLEEEKQRIEFITESKIKWLSTKPKIENGFPKVRKYCIASNDKREFRWSLSKKTDVYKNIASYSEDYSPEIDKDYLLKVA